MTKTFCNSCGKVIDEASVTVWDLHIAIPNPENPVTAFHFHGEVGLGVWKFSSTDKHFCNRCVLGALKKAVAELEVEGGT